MAVVGSGLLPPRSYMGVCGVVVSVAELLPVLGSSVALVAPAVLLTRLWSGVLAKSGRASGRERVALAAGGETEQKKVWPMPQAVGGSPAAKVSTTKVKAEGRTSVRSTLWASWGPWLVTATW